MVEDKAKKKAPDKPKAPPALKRETFQDGSGIPRVVLLPPHETDKRRGIPLSLDLGELYGHMPPEFVAALTQALHRHGLVEAKDYFKKGAAEAYQRALRDVLKHDFQSIQALAKKEL